MSYCRLLGEPLIAREIATQEAAAWLIIGRHLASSRITRSRTPSLCGNRRAQELFEYSWDELTVLPSRLSAQAPDQNDRQAFLEQVERHRFVGAYPGMRVAKSGKRFWIENAVVWQLHDETGKHYGQAALILGSSTA